VTRNVQSGYRPNQHSRKVVGLYLERPLWLAGRLKWRFGYSDLKEAAGNRLAMEFECC